ncbi:hypothetical protein [Actinoplanes sp. DH11]|uniref:hypothetical protein n=1 Tax=Actinoplanes sp. DH11 TaxID=2857011 RepID=UPI001E3B0B0B|nr:hypothetical protein [Actinoplanes sp. DH11]
MPVSDNPIGRRSVLKVLAAASVLATPLTAGSPDRGRPTDHRHTRTPGSPNNALLLAHETLIGVL